MQSINPTSSNKQRVMIIVWKWQEQFLEGNGAKETDNADSPDRLYCLWDEGTAVDMQKGFNSIQAKIIGIVAQNSPEADIYVFLHRTAGYPEERIRQIHNALKAPEVSPKERLVKCFSFGHGRDYLYIGVNIAKETGLLGEVRREERGNMQGFTNNKIGISAITHDGKIKYTHFDDVWRHYTHQFKNKIFDLKEELLIHFCALCIRNNKIKREELFNHLYSKSNHVDKARDDARFLYLKVMRFIDAEDEDENKELKELDEKVGGESMVFEKGCQANLEAIYHVTVVEAYKALKNEINHNLAGGAEGKAAKQLVNPNEIMDDIRDSFKKLLDAIPGKNYY